VDAVSSSELEETETSTSRVGTESVVFIAEVGMLGELATMVDFVASFVGLGVTVMTDAPGVRGGVLLAVSSPEGAGVDLEFAL
jgi:hypothetical protein